MYLCCYHWSVTHVHVLGGITPPESLNVVVYILTKICVFFLKTERAKLMMKFYSIRNISCLLEQ